MNGMRPILIPIKRKGSLMRKASRCSFTCVFNISAVMPSSGPQSGVGRAFAKRFVILHLDTYNGKVPGGDLLNVKRN